MSSHTALPGMKLKEEAPTGLICDKRSKGWTLIREGDQVEGEPDLKFLPFLHEGETTIVGTVMMERAIAMEGGLASQYHAERMFGQLEQIPAELRPFYLVFAGTEWRRPDGRLGVPCLGRPEGLWVLGFRLLDGEDWDSSDRLVRLRK